MDEESRDELKLRITNLSDDQLLQMVTVDADEYRQEALDHANAELRARGIDVTKAPAEAPVGDAVDKEDTASLDPMRGLQPSEARHLSQGPICLTCGGPMRPGILVAEKELSIVFTDNREERFVRVSGCSQCGQLSLTVDFENEVV